MSTYLETIQAYFDLLGDFATDPEEFALILHPDIQHTEYPNPICPNIRTSNLEGLLKGCASGKELLANQRFELLKSYGCGDTVIIEGHWQGTIGTERGQFKAGQTLSAWLCIVFEFKDGLIWRQRNYDCYEPF